MTIDAKHLRLQPVSVTRRMAASLPGLRKLAEDKGLKIHHLGAGYPHPEVTDPRGFVDHRERYFEHLAEREGVNDPALLPEYLRESFSYTDTLGPRSTRAAFARIYGADWGLAMDADALIPTMGATGGISLVCAMFERPGVPLAYITDAPTYAGFVTRAQLCQNAAIYSVDMDDQGPIPAQFREQIRAARAAGRFVPLYYTVPDGHNPAGFSFSQTRREEILDIARDEGVLIVEDAPYLYINYAAAGGRARPFFAMDPEQTIHLFTGSKIGFPGPRVGFLYSQAKLAIANGDVRTVTEFVLAEASADILFQNPAALYGFEALLHDDELRERDSLWPVAEQKLAVYRDNRNILLDGLSQGLGKYPEHFRWTHPDAGFFSVFTFLQGRVRTDETLVSRLVSDYGVVTIPMYEFYPDDARRRNANAGYDQLRLSFCFNESVGEQRRRDLRQAVAAFCTGAKALAGV